MVFQQSVKIAEGHAHRQTMTLTIFHSSLLVILFDYIGKQKGQKRDRIFFTLFFIIEEYSIYIKNKSVGVTAIYFSFRFSVCLKLK